MVNLAVGIPGGWELWIILAVVLLLFGGRKLPELARSMGSSITQFKKGLKEDGEAKLPEGSAGGAKQGDEARSETSKTEA